MDVIALTKKLIHYDSASMRSNNDIADFLEEQLQTLDFTVERVTYRDANDVEKVNLVARKGPGTEGIALLAHMDTVPAEDWDYDPFTAFIEDGKLYGRGSSDMKGALACMLCATEQFKTSEFRNSLYLLFSSDEETGCAGARAIAENSQLFKQSHPQYGVIGEPTSLEVVHSHKGAVQFHAVARGHAAHSSTGKGFNANLKMIPFLNEMHEIYTMLTTQEKYFNSDFDPPFADWNIVISDGDTAPNVTAPWSRCIVNFRPMPGYDVDAFIAKVQALGNQNDVQIEVRRFGEPLLTSPDSPIVQTALEITDNEQSKTVPYGTDALALGGHMELILLGPGDIKQSHTVGEWIEVEQLYKATDIYSKLIEKFCIDGN